MTQILPKKTREILALAFKQMLSRDEDRSQNINGIGFNKFDSKEIHKDIDGKPDVTDDIHIKHAHRLQRYKKQLTAMGFDEDDLTSAIDDACKFRNAAPNNFEYGIKQQPYTSSFSPTVPSYIPITPDNVTEVPLEEKVCAEKVPETLKGLNRFTVWKPVYENGKIKKIPYGKEGNLCKWRDPSSLMSFDKAYDVLRNHPEFGGLQFALYKMDGFISIDYDHVIDSTGIIDNRTLSDLEIMDYPYTEFTPSGNGLRVFFYGELPKAQYHIKGLPEFYSDFKILTVTGHHLDITQKDIDPVNPEKLLQVLRSYYPDEKKGKGPGDIPRTQVSFTDQEVIDNVSKSKIGADFVAAYCNGKDIKDDPSATDSYVVSKMAFYTQGLKQLYNLMLESPALTREKWFTPRNINELWGKELDKLGIPRNYLSLTIVNTLCALDQVYMQEGKHSFWRSYGPNYYCNPSGIFVKEMDRVNKEEGSTFKEMDVRLSATPAYISAAGNNKKDEESYVKLTYINRLGDIIHKWVQPDALTIKSNLTKLANYISMDDYTAGKLTKYFRIAIDIVSQEGPHEEVYSSIGYYDNNTSFVLGGRKITANTIEDIVPLNMPLANKLVKVGSLEKYVEAGKFLMEFDVLRAKTYGMMGSLILDLVYGRNITLTHTATSGNLKGDSAYWIMGAFGNPVTLQLNPSSTNLGFQGHMAQMQGLPTSVEELTEHPEILKQIQYYTTSGVTRTTSKRNSEPKGGDKLLNIVCVNSENPIFSTKDRLGNNVRNINLDEKIEKEFSNEKIIELEEQIMHNYGHAAELLIQIILQEKDNLKNLMIAYEANLPPVSGIPEKRYKNMIAFVTVSGYLCEKWFTKLGIPNKNPLEIMTKVMQRNLEDGVVDPLYIKVLDVVAEFYSEYKADFKNLEPGEREPSRRKGYIERKNLCILPSVFEELIEKKLGVGNTKPALRELGEHKCIKMRDEKSHKYKADHNGIPVYKIFKSSLKEHTGLDLDAKEQEDGEEGEGNGEKKDDKQKNKPEKEETKTSKPADRVPEILSGTIDSSAYFEEG